MQWYGEGFVAGLTVLLSADDHELQHLVHGSHKEDDSQLSHSHSDQTPQKDGREHGAPERDRSWETDFQEFVHHNSLHQLHIHTTVTNGLKMYHSVSKTLTLCVLSYSRQFLSFSRRLFRR